jgi:hypothetical protein
MKRFDANRKLLIKVFCSLGNFQENEFETVPLDTDLDTFWKKMGAVLLCLRDKAFVNRRENIGDSPTEIIIKAQDINQPSYGVETPNIYMSANQLGTVEAGEGVESSYSDMDANPVRAVETDCDFMDDGVDTGKVEIDVDGSDSCGSVSKNHAIDSHDNIHASKSSERANREYSVSAINLIKDATYESKTEVEETISSEKLISKRQKDDKLEPIHFLLLALYHCLKKMNDIEETDMKEVVHFVKWAYMDADTNFMFKLGEQPDNLEEGLFQLFLRAQYCVFYSLPEPCREEALDLILTTWHRFSKQVRHLSSASCKLICGYVTPKALKLILNKESHRKCQGRLDQSYSQEKEMMKLLVGSISQMEAVLRKYCQRITDPAADPLMYLMKEYLERHGELRRNKKRKIT